MLRTVLNNKCILYKLTSRRYIQRSLERSLSSVCLLLESSEPHLASTDSAQPLHGSTEVSSSNAPGYLEPCSACVMVPWPGLGRRKDFLCGSQSRAVRGGAGLSCSLEPVLERAGSVLVPLCRVVSAWAPSCLPWTRISSRSVLAGQCVFSSDALLFSLFPCFFLPASACGCTPTAWRLCVFCSPSQALRTPPPVLHLDKPELAQ